MNKYFIICLFAKVYNYLIYLVGFICIVMEPYYTEPFTGTDDL